MRHIILKTIGLLWLACNFVACSLTQFNSGSKAAEESKPAPPKLVAKERVEDACLFIRSGADLDVTQKSTFAGVGMLSLPGGGICSGALIAPNVVLTAQHCVSDASQKPFKPEEIKFMPFDGADIVALDQAGRTAFFNDFNTNPEARSGAKIVQWAEENEQFRDVSLVVLNKPYSADYPTYEFSREALVDADAGTTVLTMVGFGGYTNAEDPTTYEVGKRRIGQTFYDSMLTVAFPDFVNEDKFGASTDYIQLLPVAEQNNQIICAGDSGSSLFREVNGEMKIVGITSLGAADNRADPMKGEEVCAFGANGLFVPAAKIVGWVDRVMDELQPKFEVKFEATIAKVEKSEEVEEETFQEISFDTLKKVKVKQSKEDIDGTVLTKATVGSNGDPEDKVELPEFDDKVDAKFCEKGCVAQGEKPSSFKLTDGAKVVVRGQIINDQFYVTDIEAAKEPEPEVVKNSAEQNPLCDK